MKRFKRTLLGLAILLILNTLPNTLDAQVTIGSGIAPTKGALLELKTQQANADNETTGAGGGGFILPRVKLQGLRTLKPLMTDTEATDELKKQLAGLMVYNLYTDNLPNPVLYPGVYIWDGESWGTSGINKSATPMNITGQPEAFSFYEKGTETIVALEFSVDPPLDQEGNISGTINYQWYQVTGNNVHVRVGTKIGEGSTIAGTGATTNKFTPTGVRKGTTRDAKNTGFYKFYCEATANGATVTSDIAEVAVGCGAKNNDGEWLSFMCFNLGADNTSTIQSQKDYTISDIQTAPGTGIHTYIPGEEKVWGDLFQWGRISDGHEKRQSPIVAYSTVTLADIKDGKLCQTVEAPRPFRQIDKDNVNLVGHFISGSVEWNPDVSTTIQTLWRSGRFVQNDPCAHYKTDGTYQSYWHTGTNQSPDSDACVDTGTGWRIPTISEWYELYKGADFVGTTIGATANTWFWNTKNGRGYEVRPDAVTTTLFLPANGLRENNLLKYQGNGGRYWSSTATADRAVPFIFDAGNLYNSPAMRSMGEGIRCIKNL